MKFLHGGGRLATFVLRVLLGSRPERDADFEAALDSALSREQRREYRLSKLQDRVDVIQRR
jgi:hypothetical protein